MNDRLVAACGGSLETAVDTGVAFLRLLWKHASDPSHWTGEHLRIDYWQIVEQLPAATIECLLQPFPREGRDHLLLTANDLDYTATFRRILGDAARPHDLRYLTLRSIRRARRIHLTAAVLHQLHSCAEAAAGLMENSAEPEDVPFSKIRECLEAAIAPESAGPVSAQTPVVEAYIEIGLVLGFLVPAPGFQAAALMPQAADRDYLLSYVFGMPTSIRGFDSLFGGGGLMLVDAEPAPSGASGSTPLASAVEPIGSRVVLTVGPYGSGKSLLSLQMAVEVARKGGVAWVMALEQSEEECLYSLESMHVSTEDKAFNIVRGASNAYMALTASPPREGAIIFLRPGDETWDAFLTTLMGQLSWMNQYSLRLLVVDPVDALVDGRAHDAKIRTETRKLFAEAKRQRVNLWLTSERPQEKQSQDDFAESIADTVIRVGVDPDPLHQRRYLQITKSRLQAEQPGHHAMVIEGGRGIRIDMSSSAPQRLSPPPVRGLEPNPARGFGVPGMEDLLGTAELQPGDIIALAGPGKSKTLLGGEFLRARGVPRDPRRTSLFVSDYSPERIRRFIENIFPKQSSGTIRRHDDVRYSLVSAGYVDPGRVLQDIQDSLEACRDKNGAQADRVLITNLARWEQEMPLVAKDSTFGVALINLLRQYMVTAVLVCGDDTTRGKSTLRDIIFDSSDFLLDFTRVQSRGNERTFIRAVKTRLMRHPRIAFELLIEPSGSRAVPAPMLHINAAGDLRPVRIKLFLHSETENHARYNLRLRGALRTSISPKTEIAKQSEHYDPTILAMTRLSAVDELQVIQLDEFQLPHSAALLTSFSRERAGDLLEGRLEGLLRHVSYPDRKSFVAVPYYENISFLAHRLKDLPPSWEELANFCEESEPYLKDNEVAFSCPIYADAIETYSCLFLEILKTLLPDPPASDCELLAWLSTPQAVDAAVLFRRLCHRSHVMGYRKHVQPRALVARHWYNTLNQELANSEPADRARVEVRALYGNVTTAGEWYLAVPGYSASPDVGLEIIRNLTTPAREMERLHMGVGLPTRQDFYHGSSDAASKAATSRYFRFGHEELGTLVQNALRRSRFDCYQEFSSTLASHLLWLVEIPGSTKDMRRDVELTMASLVSSMNFLRQSLSCGACAASGRNPDSPFPLIR